MSSVVDADPDNTPVAGRLTAAGRGAVATIRFHGPASILDDHQPLFRAVNGKPVADQQIRRIVFGHWSQEEVVVCRFDSEVTEIFCHGGDAATERILGDLANRDVAILDGFELMARTQTTFQSECQFALSHAPTVRTANVLLNQSSGVVETRVSELLIAAENENWSAIAEVCRKWQSWFHLGGHLVESWSMVLIGRPNVGKSSLINRILGFERAIVFDQPGTTRDLLSSGTAIEGWPVEFTDTAGLREADDDIEAAGISKTVEQIGKADLKVILLDASSGLVPEDEALIADHPDAIVVWNKSDVIAGSRTLFEQTSNRFLSAVTGDGTAELLTEISQRLVPSEPNPDDVVPFTSRQRTIVENMIRDIETGRTELIARSLHRYLNEPEND